MLKLRKIKPIGTKILVTANLYGWDDFNENGIIEPGHKRGDLKSYQEVISVGDDVKYIEPGQTVEVNFYKYAVFKEDPNSIKAMADNPIVGFRFDTVTLEGTDGEDVECIMIDFRDVKYIMDDWDETTYKNKKLIKVQQPKTKLILPDNKIKV